MKVYRDRDGNRHREDGPAVIHPDGRQEWWVHGDLRHRLWPDGTQGWWLHGNRHREDGPAIVSSDGTQEWWLHGKEVDPMQHLVVTSK